MDVYSLTLPKFRSGLDAPAVAQAPIVTSSFDERRTRWMRSASCGVVIDPSTSEMS